MRERFVGVRQRQQVVEVPAADPAPAQVLGDERGLGALDQARELREVGAVERVRAAERHAHAVQRQRIVGANARERRQRGSAVHVVVLAVDLEPRHRRTLGEHLPDVRRAQADAGAGERGREILHRATGRTARRPAGSRDEVARDYIFGACGLAADLLARALGDVLPFARVVVLLRALAGAGVLGRAAVVLAALGDAVALFRVRWAGGRAG